MIRVLILISRVCISLTIVTLTGCAAPKKPLYEWGNYQRQVYESMKGDGTSPNEQLTVLLAQAEKARAGQASLPPGFRAHVGLVQLRLGQDNEARMMFEEEKLAFPESTTFMDFLLKRTTEKKS
jgi:hypothetical protein